MTTLKRGTCLVEASWVSSFWKVAHDAASLNSVEKAGYAPLSAFECAWYCITMNEGGTAEVKPFRPFEETEGFFNWFKQKEEFINGASESAIDAVQI